VHQAKEMRGHANPQAVQGIDCACSADDEVTSRPLVN
jgi:hypothetical protein